MVIFWESKPSLNFVSNQWIAWQQEVCESSVSPSFHHSSSFIIIHHHSSSSSLIIIPTTSSSSSLIIIPTTSSSSSLIIIPTTSSSSLIIIPTTSSSSLIIIPTTSSSSLIITHHHSNNIIIIITHHHSNNIIIIIILIINTYQHLQQDGCLTLQEIAMSQRGSSKGIFFVDRFSAHGPVGRMGISISRYWFMLIYGFVNQSNPYQPYLLVYIDIGICYQYKSHVHKSTCIAAWDIFCVSPLEFMKQTSLFSYSVFSVFSQFFQDESQSLTTI